MTSLSSKQQIDLQRALDMLKRKAELGFGLKVEWLPGHVKYSNEGKVLRGEVLGTKIFLYDSDFEDAKKTLLHEFIEYFVNQAINPYRRVFIELISFFEDQAYDQREKIVKALARIIDCDY